MYVDAIIWYHVRYWICDLLKKWLIWNEGAYFVYLYEKHSLIIHVMFINYIASCTIFEFDYTCYVHWSIIEDCHSFYGLKRDVGNVFGQQLLKKCTVNSRIVFCYPDQEQASLLHLTHSSHWLTLSLIEKHLKMAIGDGITNTLQVSCYRICKQVCYWC